MIIKLAKNRGIGQLAAEKDDIIKAGDEYYVNQFKKLQDGKNEVLKEIPAGEDHYVLTQADGKKLVKGKAAKPPAK